mmetsp:Transcript_23652/g.71054  ORF Transcript_23652/g.71054 Transcript_23652/m.71054 type:complete len:265 (+) Transcript_23652:408-1202(+)
MRLAGILVADIVAALMPPGAACDVDRRLHVLPVEVLRPIIVVDGETGAGLVFEHARPLLAKRPPVQLCLRHVLFRANVEGQGIWIVAWVGAVRNYIDPREQLREPSVGLRGAEFEIFLRDLVLVRGGHLVALLRHEAIILRARDQTEIVPLLEHPVIGVRIIRERVAHREPLEVDLALVVLDDVQGRGREVVPAVGLGGEVEGPGLEAGVQCHELPDEGPHVGRGLGVGVFVVVLVLDDTETHASGLLDEDHVGEVRPRVRVRD